MNPFIENALRRLVPVVVAFLVPVLARWLDVETATRLAADASSFLVAIILSTLQSFRSRQEKLAGLALPEGSTEEDAKKAVKNGEAPSVKTAVHEVPVLGTGTGS